LESIGIEWFPSQYAPQTTLLEGIIERTDEKSEFGCREWALLIPSWITMSIVYVYLSYSFLNMSNNSTGLFVEMDENDDLIDSYSNGTLFSLTLNSRKEKPGH